VRVIKHIVIHCTATSSSTTVQSILAYWKYKKRWKFPGYHYLIKDDGEIVELLNINKASNGVRGHNNDSIHLAYIGGVDDRLKAKDTRTKEQIESMIRLLFRLKARFPNAEIKGHRDFDGVAKDCPSFNVYKFLTEIGL